MAADPRMEAPPASTLHDSPPSSVLPRPRTGLDFLTSGGFTPTPVTAAPIAPSVCENGKPDSPEHPYPFTEMDAVPLIPFSPCPSPSSAGNPTTEKDGGESRGAEKTGPWILTLEELQLKAKQQWNRHFPWLIIGDTSEDVRWLSRGDAIERFADVLPAAVVLLHEYDKATYTLVTSLKFQFFLFFLVDVLQELNSLNLKFQWRQLDATQVQSMVQHTTLCLTSRYVEYGSTFGDNSGRLATFLKNHGSTENREVKVESIDDVGTPVTHSYVLHEDLIGKEKFGGDLASCVEAASKFAGRTVFYIDDRMKSLKSLDGSRLFRQGRYPRSRAKKARRFPEWLQSLRNLFKKKPSHPDTLPGVDWGKADKELTSFTTILSTHHKDLSFHDSLSQMLSTPDWESAYPNLGRLWIAVAVLLLSTVECERGFSRQNIIKSWVRGSLCDTTLGDQMTVSLLDYELNTEELVDSFYGGKKRRPAREVVMAEGSRPVKRRRSHQLKKRAAATEAAAAATRAREEAEEAATRERERAAEEAAWELPTWRKGKNRATIVETSESGSGSDDDSDISSDDSESNNASESS
ncbi:unnamed protein product [Closterium sp. NIES-53]